MVRTFCASLVVLALGGCSDSGDPNSGASASGGSAGTSGGATGGAAGALDAGQSGAGGVGPECETGPGHAVPGGDPHYVDTLVGTIVDALGNPVPDVRATICGLDVCVVGATNAEGKLVQCDRRLSICADGIRADAEIRRPAFKYGDGLHHARMAFPLPTTDSLYDLGTLATVVLPPLGSGTTMQPGTTASMNDIELAIPSGASITLDVLTYETEESQRFRALEIALANAPPAIDPALGFELVVVTVPLETRFCPKARLSLPNLPGYAAGSELELWLHGDLLDEAWAPYAGWAKVADAQPSADGTRIEADIPMLGVFGVRAK